MEKFLIILGNTILVSIPEELFIAILIQSIANRNFIDISLFKKHINILIPPVIISALFSNIIRYNGYQQTIVALLPPLVLFMIILKINFKYNYNEFNIKNIIIHTVKAFLISIFVLGAIEIFVALGYTNIINIKLQTINENIFLNFIIVLPCRIIEYLILFIIIIKYSHKINLLKLFTNIKNIIPIIIFGVINIIILAIESKIADKNLIVILFCCHLLLIFLICWIIYNIVFSERYQ